MGSGRGTQRTDRHLADRNLRIPDAFTTDPFNHRPNDFVPPVDFDAAFGEPAGPWNDANNDYNTTAQIGLGDRKPALLSFAGRDSSAAAIAASGLIELSCYASLPADQARFLSVAEQCHRTGSGVEITFEITSSAPALTFRVERSADLTDGSWATLAARTGAGPWTGSATVSEEILPNGRRRVKIADPAPGASGFFRILTHSVGGGR